MPCPSAGTTRASNDCSPARSTLLTGLYTHQTGCMITGGSTLDPGFPTWGTMLREHGYSTRWLGKWHLTHGDNHWTALSGEQALERYGFDGGVFPSPDGAPGQGWKVDPHITKRFADWFANEGGARAVVHDRVVREPARHRLVVQVERSRPDRGRRRACRNELPPNFETPELLVERHKPRLQRSFQETAAASFGAVPFSGPEATETWLDFLDLYVAAPARGRSAHRPGPAHPRKPSGGGSEHGDRVHLRPRRVRRLARPAGQGCERLRGGPTRAVAREGSAREADERARNDAHAADLERRCRAAAADDRHRLRSMAPGSALLAHRRAARPCGHPRRTPKRRAGRSSCTPPTRPSPSSRSNLTPPTRRCTSSRCARRRPSSRRTRTGLTKGSPRSRKGRKSSCTTTRTQSGRLELHNSAGHSPLEEALRGEYELAFKQELRGPLPPRLVSAHARGFADYFSTARHAAVTAALRRKRRSEREAGGVTQEVPEQVLPPSSSVRPRF